MDYTEKCLIEELTYKDKLIKQNRLPVAEYDRIVECVYRLKKEYKYKTEYIEETLPMINLFIQYRGRMS
jgi:hypothetical protein